MICGFPIKKKTKPKISQANHLHPKYLSIKCPYRWIGFKLNVIWNFFGPAISISLFVSLSITWVACAFVVHLRWRNLLWTQIVYHFSHFRLKNMRHQMVQALLKMFRLLSVWAEILWSISWNWTIFSLNDGLDKWMTQCMVFYCIKRHLSFS